MGKNVAPCEFSALWKVCFDLYSGQQCEKVCHHTLAFGGEGTEVQSEDAGFIVTGSHCTDCGLACIV